MGAPNPPPNCSRYKSGIIKFLGISIRDFHQAATVTFPIAQTGSVTSNSDILKTLTLLLFFNLNLIDPIIRTLKNLNIKLGKKLGNINYSHMISLILTLKVKLNQKSLVLPK